MTVRDTRETRGNLAEQTDFGEAVTGSLQEQHRHLHLAQMPRPFGAGLGNSYALFRAPTGSRSCACSKGGTVQIFSLPLPRFSVRREFQRRHCCSEALAA